MTLPRRSWVPWILGRALLLSMTLCAALFVDTPARAQDGFAVNRFNPAERGSDWFWAESLDLRGHGRPAVGITGDWAYKPLVSYDENGDELDVLIRHQVYVHAGASVALWNRLRLGLNVPVLVFQEGQDTVFDGTEYEAPSKAALGDVRLGADLRLFGKYGGPITGALGAQVFLPTGNQNNFTGDGATRLEPRLAVAGDLGIFTYAVRTGIQVRFDESDFADQAKGSEWTFGGAIGLRLVDDKLTIGPEVWGSTVITDGGDGFFETGSTPLEGVLGAHYRIGQFVLGAAAGPGFTEGLGSPQLRTLVSLDWFPLPKEKTEPPPPPPDTDGDGILDADDACPTERGVRNEDPQKNGCPPPNDRDGDGIPDEQDACPDQPGPQSDIAEKHGCPLPLDVDQDGIYDTDDACPEEPGPVQDDPEKNGCPLRDSDSDGILNEVDACPNEAGVESDDPEKHGCPKARIVEGQVTIRDRIEFDSGKATLRPESTPVLAAVLQILQEHPELEKVRIEGHTDNRGSAAFNKKLSRQRAESVQKWLVDQGVDASRLSAAGFGPDEPIDDNETESGRQNNRRVEFHIIEGGAAASPAKEAQ